MKPAPFDYVRAEDAAHACALLASDPAARPIAGGQTLIPLLAMRLARPTCLVDLAPIAALRGARMVADGLAIGAMTRQAEALDSPLVARAAPLLARALTFVGHAPTRHRGTIGGSLANADPAAEIALVAVTLGGRLEILDGTASQMMPAADFFLAPLTTAIGPGQLLGALHLPRPPAGRTGVGFAEVSTRASDFAFAAVAVQLVLDVSGALLALDVGVGAATETPMRIDLSAELGGIARPERIIAALDAALAGADLMSDLHASGAYRRRAALALADRALADALRMAQAASPDATSQEAGANHAGHA